LEKAGSVRLDTHLGNPEKTLRLENVGRFAALTIETSSIPKPTQPGGTGNRPYRDCDQALRLELSPSTKDGTQRPASVIEINIIALSPQPLAAFQSRPVRLPRPFLFSYYGLGGFRDV